MLAYILGLTYLQLIMAFLAPKEDPVGIPEEDGEFSLPVHESDEYKGF